jgi:hypothetical protein
VVLVNAINVPYRLLTFDPSDVERGGLYAFDDRYYDGMVVERLEWARTSTPERRVGEWLYRFARPGETLAIDAAGVVPYYSRLPTLDTFGLTDRVIARQPVPVRGWVGHEKRATPEYVRQFEPTFYVPELGKMIRNRFRCAFEPETICVKIDDFFFSFMTAKPVADFRDELRRRGAIVVDGPNPE